MILTPRGLKVDIELNHALALLLRLRNYIHPYKFMCSVEAVGYIPGFMYLLSCLIGFIFNFDLIFVIFCSIFAHIIATFLNIFGLYIIPFGLSITKLLRVSFGYFIPQIIVYSIGIYKIGIVNTLLIFIIQIIYSAIMGYVSAKITEITYKRFMPSAVRDFLNLYSYYAIRFGAEPNWNVSDYELYDEKLIEINEELLERYNKRV